MQGCLQIVLLFWELGETAHSTLDRALNLANVVLAATVRAAQAALAGGWGARW